MGFNSGFKGLNCSAVWPHICGHTTEQFNNEVY